MIFFFQKLFRRDEQNRKHHLNLELPSSFPAAPPKITADLPIVFTIQWTFTSSFLDIISQFESHLHTFQPFWSIMEDFDKHCWVMEPEFASFSATMRRIALGNHNSLHIVIDPAKPNLPPNCQFIGSDSKNLTEKLNQNFQLWNQDQSPRQNLQKLLGLVFPEKSSAQSDAHLNSSVECGICYAFNISDETPDNACNNCNQVFHKKCLMEWFRSNPSSKMGLDRVYGECPYCSTSFLLQK